MALRIIPKSIFHIQPENKAETPAKRQWRQRHKEKLGLIEITAFFFALALYFLCVPLFF